MTQNSDATFYAKISNGTRSYTKFGLKVAKNQTTKHSWFAAIIGFFFCEMINPLRI